MITANEIPAELSMIDNLIETNPMALQAPRGMDDSTMIKLFALASGNTILRAYVGVDTTGQPLTLNKIALFEAGVNLENLEQRDLEKLDNSRFDEQSLAAAFADFVNGLLEAKDSTEDHTWSWTLGNRTSTALSEVYDSASGDFHYMSVEHSDGWASGGWLGLVETQVAKAA